MIRVWLISGDESFYATLQVQLSAAGMEVGVLRHADEWQRLIQRADDIAIVDADLRGDSGHAIAARLRMATSAGVLLLGSSEAREDRLLGLSMGVDHYLVKPVQARELELLIRNLHRRLTHAETLHHALTSSAAVPDDTEPRWRYDMSAWRLTTPDGVEIALSLAEYLLLGRLLEAPGEVVSRDELVEAMTRRKARIYSRHLDMVVSRLRRKVESAGPHKLPVQAARGLGYVFTGHCEITEGAKPMVASLALARRIA